MWLEYYREKNIYSYHKLLLGLKLNLIVMQLLEPF